MTPAALATAARETAERSCAEQGLDVAVTDPAVLGRLARIIAARPPAKAGEAA